MPFFCAPGREMLRESRAGDLAHVEGRVLEVDRAGLERREVVHVGEDGLQRLGGTGERVSTRARLFVVEPGLGLAIPPFR